MASSDDEMPDAHMSAHISLSAPPDDPERHGVVSDFIDYTEYFPSDMIRSLTLIRTLDERCEAAFQQVHEYALQLSKPVSDAVEIRKKMSRALNQATVFREASCAEANRLLENSGRNSKRLSLIRKKLQALPLPPSRDPTPVPVSSPQATRARKEAERAPKLTLHVDGGRKGLKHRRVLVPGDVLPPPSASDGAYTQTEESSGDDLDDGEIVIIERRGRKAGTIKIPKTPKLKTQKTPRPLKIRGPGQVGTNVHSQVAGISTSNALAMLTPPPADAKPGSKYMPWFKLTEYEMATLRKHMKKNAVWTPSDTMIRRYLRDHKRGPEFYETAKAEAEAKGEELLDEDPIDPDKEVLGPGEVAPNLPSGQSQALENRGMRLNVAKKEKALARKEQAEKEAAEAAEAAETANAAPAPVEEAETSKKSRKDKAPKKDKPTRSSSKKDKLQRAISNIDDLGLGNLFTNNATPVQESPPVTTPVTSKKNAKSSKKRKRDSEGQTVVAAPVAEASAVKDTPVQPGPKKLKINHPALAPKPAGKQKEPVSPTKTTTVTTTTQVPLAPAGASLTKASSKKAAVPDPVSPTDMRGQPIQPTAAGSRPRRVSNIVHATVESSAEASPATSTSKEVKIADDFGTKDRDLRPRSRGSIANKAASAEPPSKIQSRDLREKRRASVVEAHPVSDSAAIPSATAPRATRANRRPAPGFVTAAEDGKGKVSVGKRKAAPKKGGKGAEKELEEEDVPIDPDEPRYCICGGVSWGTMVACENPECEKEWFHLNCVELKEPPGRRQMWYCPECREKLHVFANGDPVVESSRRR